MFSKHNIRYPPGNYQSYDDHHSFYALIWFNSLCFGAPCPLSGSLLGPLCIAFPNRLSFPTHWPLRIFSVVHTVDWWASEASGSTMNLFERLCNVYHVASATFVRSSKTSAKLISYNFNGRISDLRTPECLIASSRFVCIQNEYLLPFAANSQQ